MQHQQGQKLEIFLLLLVTIGNTSFTGGSGRCEVGGQGQREAGMVEIIRRDNNYITNQLDPLPSSPPADAKMSTNTPIHGFVSNWLSWKRPKNQAKVPGRREYGDTTPEQTGKHPVHTKNHSWKFKG